MSIDIVRQPNARAQLGESPVWDPETGAIWWIDIDQPRLFCRDSRETIDSWTLPETPGFVVLLGSGQLALGMETGIFTFDPNTGAFERIVDLNVPGMRFNDATIDWRGRLFASTMARDAKPGRAAIHLVSPHHTLTKLIDGLAIPNGLAIDQVGNRLFYSDSHPDSQSIRTRSISDDGAISEQDNLFATTRGLDGRPDGASMDALGRYWIAGVDGGAIYIFEHDGRLDEVIPLPFACPTKLAFTGTTGTGMAITSKSVGDDGGYLTLATPPGCFAGGIVQPYWDPSQ